jgi:hypothetical protein
VLPPQCFRQREEEEEEEEEEEAAADDGTRTHDLLHGNGERFAPVRVRAQTARSSR